VEKMLTMAKLGIMTFLGCTRGNIWALDIQDEAWAKKVGIASLKKFN